MIPTENEAKKLWEKYRLPENKRVHVALVARVAVYLGTRMNERGQANINIALLNAAALLHDIDKVALRRTGERHPDTAVRILREEGFSEVADVVVAHSLHAILDPAIAPRTWEQKLLYLADKMVKYDIVGVDKRFALWRDEHLPTDAEKILDESYPRVKRLEKEVFDMTGITPQDLVKLAS